MASCAEQAKKAYDDCNAKLISGEGTKEECAAVTDLLYDLLKDTFTKYYECINANQHYIANESQYLDNIIIANKTIQVIITEMYILSQKISNPDQRCYRTMSIPCTHQHAIRPLHKMRARPFINPDA